MIISTNWIKDFVELPEISPQDLSTRFTMATCEVEDLEITGEILKKIVIVKIQSIRKHPEADKLNLVTVKTPQGEKEVVCGAPNVREGLKVPYAGIGTTLPGGFTLEPKKIRGVLSEGMLCSEAELGISENHEGLMELPADAPEGKTLAEFLQTDPDILLEIDNKSITHRPDLWGHYGMAREFAAVFEKPLNRPFSEDWKNSWRSKLNSDKPPVTLDVHSDSACLGFIGLSVDNITIKDSPSWIQQRLNLCGMRPINNIVDISNYVMLELGMPNHIFDRTTLKEGKIIVRRTGANQVFTTLDEQERNLLATDTVVCDAERPMAIAGIMGGLDSSVTESTTSIFIEVANWKAGEIRHTSSRLGLRTDASQRYEKSLDTEQLETALFRLLELITESCPEAKPVGQVQESGIVKNDILVISTSAERICHVLGKVVSEDAIISILEALDFSVEKSSGILKITVPSFRATKDIECEADIVEEIGRVIGYDNITPEAPHSRVQAIQLAPAKKLYRKIQDYLTLSAEASEIKTYPFSGEPALNKARWTDLNEPLILSNALTPEHDRMRPSLVPSLLEAAALNQKTYSRFRLFETGRCFRPDGKDFSQDRYHTGVLFYDKTVSPLTDLINHMEKLMDYTDIPAQLNVGAAADKNPLLVPDWPGLHPRENLEIRIMGRTCGFIASIHPIILRNYKIKGNVALAVFDTTDFQDKEMKSRIKYRPLPKFPSSVFDCTVVTDTKTPVADILSPLKKLKITEIDSIKIADIYALSENQKTVTIRTTFLDRNKTMDREFLHQAEDKIVAELRQAGFPLKGTETE